MSDTNEQRGRQRGDLFWFYALLGSIFSAFAIISLTQKVFDVGLAPVMQEILDYYRGIVHPIMDWLLVWVRWLLPDWPIPTWVKDLYSLSFVGAAGLTRSMMSMTRFPGDPVRERIYGRVALPPFMKVLFDVMNILVGVMAALTFGGLLVWIGALVLTIAFAGPLRHETFWSALNWSQGFGQRFVVLFWLTLVEAVAFFAINSQL